MAEVAPGAEVVALGVVAGAPLGHTPGSGAPAGAAAVLARAWGTAF